MACYLYKVRIYRSHGAIMVRKSRDVTRWRGYDADMWRFRKRFS